MSTVPYKKYLFILCVMLITPALANNESVSTSQKYVDDNLGTKQNLLQEQSGDKIVVYTGTAGTPGTRDIRTELDGTSVNDTAISTVGAFDKRALGYEQDILMNIPSSNALVYADTGLVAAHAMYGSNTAFASGLVDAETVNNAILNAVENEFTAVDANGNPDPNGMLWRINSAPSSAIAIASNLNPNIAGTSTCYKSANGSSQRRNSCSTTTYNALPRGGWGTVFPYGEISGISLCTSQEPPATLKYAGGDLDYIGKYIPTNQQELQSLFDSGTSSGMFCYYKLKLPLTSPWIFGASAGSASSCMNACAQMAAYRMGDTLTWRSLTFGSLTTN